MQKLRRNPSLFHSPTSSALTGRLFIKSAKVQIGAVPGERRLQDPAGGVGSLVTVQHLQQPLLLDGKGTVADKFVAGRCRRDGLRHAATPRIANWRERVQELPLARQLVARS